MSICSFNNLCLKIIVTNFLSIYIHIYFSYIYFLLNFTYKSNLRDNFISFYLLTFFFPFLFKKTERIFYESSFIKSWERKDCLKPTCTHLFTHRRSCTVGFTVQLQPGRRNYTKRRRRGGGGERRETCIRIHEETPSIVITHGAIQISQQGLEEFSHVNSA